MKTFRAFVAAVAAITILGGPTSVPAAVQPDIAGTRVPLGCTIMAGQMIVITNTSGEAISAREPVSPIMPSARPTATTSARPSPAASWLPVRPCGSRLPIRFLRRLVHPADAARAQAMRVWPGCRAPRAGALRPVARFPGMHRRSSGDNRQRRSTRTDLDQCRAGAGRLRCSSPCPPPPAAAPIPARRFFRSASARSFSAPASGRSPACSSGFAIYAGDVTLPTAFIPRDWHVHEMLYGYVPAVVAGFLLTAIPNWTGRLPVRGLPLAALAGLWLAGRIAIALLRGDRPDPGRRDRFGFSRDLRRRGARARSSPDGTGGTSACSSSSPC